MAKLENVFSWSHSAASDFERCRRKRYWSKYAAWGGWERDAPSESKTAYRLNKMTNRFCLYGVAAEEACMWLLRQRQAGRTGPGPDEAWDRIARPLLRAAWDESLNGTWRNRPKAGCLHEHYYPQFCRLERMEIMRAIADVVKACLANFHADTLPRLAHVTPDMEVPVGVVGKGDPEHFRFEGVKVYAIPDYVYVEDGRWHIVDWKSGSPKPEHAEQLALYALWALEKHGVSPERVVLSLEYLQSGDRKEFAVAAEELEQVRDRVRESMQDMAQYLVEADLSRNLALPKPEWDLCYDPDICRSCEFYELCRPELRDAMGVEAFESNPRHD